MFTIKTIGGCPVANDICQGPVGPNARGEIVITGAYTGNVANFWTTLQMGETMHRGICGVAQHKPNNPSSVPEMHELEFYAPRQGTKYLPYRGPATLKVYLDPDSEIQFLEEKKGKTPAVVIQIDEVVVE